MHERGTRAYGGYCAIVDRDLVFVGVVFGVGSRQADRYRR